MLTDSPVPSDVLGPAPREIGSSSLCHVHVPHCPEHVVAVGFCGWSGAGKTTLLVRLIPTLVSRGYRVSVIKHAHHGFDVDRPGKDSYRHREAGANEVMIASQERWALLHERRDEPPPTLADHLARLSDCDLVLVEGFRDEPIPKIEVYRPALGRPPRYPRDPFIVAVASDAVVDADLPVLALEDTEAIADFVEGIASTERDHPESRPTVPARRAGARVLTACYADNVPSPSPDRQVGG